MFEQLKQYRKIGWDFDDTLIDHPLSEAFWDFIATNPYQQDHYIVTFRSGGLETRIFTDLMIRGSSLHTGHFVGIHSIDHALWQDHHLLPAQQRGIILLDQLSDDPYMLWKGLTCSEQGIEVLIDDMTANVIHGCKKHGIQHFHPDDLV